MHPKAVRRRILVMLYESYQVHPLQMITPAEIMEAIALSKEDLAANAYYLHDSGLVEMMMGYAPPLFAAARTMFRQLAR